MARSQRARRRASASPLKRKERRTTTHTEEREQGRRDTASPIITEKRCGFDQYNEHVQKLLNNLLGLQFAQQFAHRVRDQLLNDDERARFHNEIRCAPGGRPGAIRIWMHFRGGNVEQALTQVGYRLGQLLEVDYRYLCEQLGIPSTASTSADAFGIRWDRRASRLYRGGRVIRNVRMTSTVKFIRILDEFERLEWPEVIDNPYADELDRRPPKERAQSRRATEKIRHGDLQSYYGFLRALNRGLTEIVFEATGGGAQIRWTVRT